MKTRPVVLALNNCYAPGFKGGGPVRSLCALVDHLGAELDFRIVTLDRDKDDRAPYPGVSPGRWQKVGGAEVYYLRSGYFELGRVLRETRCDLLYLNSFFAPGFGVWPLLLERLGAARPRAVILAPRGQFSPGALELKAEKKRLYLELARRSHLYDHVSWQASTIQEAQQIHDWFGARARVFIARDLSPLAAPAPATRPEKKRGALRLVFLSRISRKKNLDLAVRLAISVARPVELDVIGPLEEPDHYREVEALARTGPPGFRLRYLGSVAPDQVCARLREYDALLFPTRGENFGHVILEALLAGCPPVISRETPWNDLDDHGAGFAIPLDQPQQFVRVLESIADMDGEQHRRLAERAAAYGRRALIENEHLEANRSMFAAALRCGSSSQ